MAARKQGKTNFAVTCNLLSQYIKEKGRIADLGLGMAPRPQDATKGKSEAFRPPTTMSLLPGADVSSGEGEQEEGVFMELFPERAGFGPSLAAVPENAREQERAPLTIFYGGKVLVFDNFPLEKAKDLFQLASRGNSTAQNFGNLPRTAQPNLSYLPIARKVSLQRFLEKRKDRIHSRAPYQVSSSPGMVTPVKQENRSWLALGGPQEAKL
ncbi:protein TIFY 10a-like [Musa acuminata AAA Group]|uniref:protein TIFY 10a-like n=1 Tax=Musa acuminata AAA Group TaxID=214697 RepID=UPI0031DBE055